MNKHNEIDFTKLNEEYRGNSKGYRFKVVERKSHNAIEKQYIINKLSKQPLNRLRKLAILIQNLKRVNW